MQKPTLEHYVAMFQKKCECGKLLKVHGFRPKGKFPQRVSAACWNSACKEYGREKFF